MLDPKWVRESVEWVRRGLAARSYPLHFLETFIKADSQWRQVLQEVDQLKSERNRLTPKGKPTPEQLETLKQIAEAVKQKQDDLNGLEAVAKEAALLIPNIPDETVPDGLTEADNVEIRSVGCPVAHSYQPLSHDQIAVNRGLIDFESATKITGSRFAVYRGNGAKLERAVINFMLDLHTNVHGYEETLPPVIVNTTSLIGTGQLPKFDGDLFRLADTDYWLSPTAEVQLTNIARDSIVDESALPIRLTAQTSCFRKEAGSYGRDIAGIIRQHQFNKIELVQLCHPDQSMGQLHELLGHAETVLQHLQLPYRVVQLCAGDLGFSSAITYDIEVWFPSQGKYREISSCSNFKTFQARRAMIRYRDSKSGSVQYLHTINGSGLAVGRTVAAILENYQNEDGSVTVPTVLKPYLGVDQL